MYFIVASNLCPGQGHSEITFIAGSLRENNEINLHNRGMAKFFKRSFHSNSAGNDLFSRGCQSISFHFISFHVKYYKYITIPILDPLAEKAVKVIGF